MRRYLALSFVSVLFLSVLFGTSESKAQLSDDDIKKMCAPYGDESPQSVEARMLNEFRQRHDKALDELRKNPEAVKQLEIVKRAFGCPPMNADIYDSEGVIIKKAVQERGCSREARIELMRQMEGAVDKLSKMLPKSKNKSDVMSLHYNNANGKVQLYAVEMAKYFGQDVRLEYRKDFLADKPFESAQMLKAAGGIVGTVDVPQECQVTSSSTASQRTKAAVSKRIAR